MFETCNSYCSGEELLRTNVYEGTTWAHIYVPENTAAEYESKGRVPIYIEIMLELLQHRDLTTEQIKAIFTFLGARDGEDYCIGTNQLRVIREGCGGSVEEFWRRFGVSKKTAQTFKRYPWGIPIQLAILLTICRISPEFYQLVTLQYYRIITDRRDHNPNGYQYPPGC